MYRFSLQTFIKICLLDTGGRISEVQRKLDPGSGYYFYNTFERAVRAYCADKSSKLPDEILSAPANDAERKYNQDAYHYFIEKFGAKRTLEGIKKERPFRPEGAAFEIMVDPVFGIEKSGTKIAYLPWLVQKPELSQRYAGVACYVMRQAFKGTNLSNWQFCVYDFIRSRTYSESIINDNTPRILATDARTISNLLIEL